MTLQFTDEGWTDYISWVGDKKMLSRINRLIEEATRDPGVGTGKPERLKGDLAGYLSRRFDQEHRLVYTVRDGALVMIQARGHY